MKFAWTWWRIGSAFFVLTLVTGAPAFARLLLHDIPHMIRGETVVISPVTANMMNVLLWPASILALVVFLLSELSKDDSQIVEWRHLLGMLTTIAVFAVVTRLAKHIPTDFPVLAIAIPVTMSFRLSLRDPKFRTRSMITLWRIPETEAPNSPKHGL